MKNNLSDKINNAETNTNRMTIHNDIIKVILEHYRVDAIHDTRCKGKVLWDDNASDNRPYCVTCGIKFDA